MKLKECVYKN